MPLCHTPYVTAKPAAFNFDNRGFKRHTLSVAHRKTKLIRAMLERDCITHAEIAGRIGLTRERVRQLALKMGFADGRSRHAICRVERRRKEMAEFFVAAQQRGFSAGGRALIPKNALGWPTLSGLVHERVGSSSSPFSNSIFY